MTNHRYFFSPDYFLYFSLLQSMNEKKHSLMKNYFSLTKLEHIPRSIPLFCGIFFSSFSLNISTCVCVCDDLCVVVSSIVSFPSTYSFTGDHFNFDTYPKLFFFSFFTYLFFSFPSLSTLFFLLDSMTNFFLLVTCTIFIYIYSTLFTSPVCMCVSFCRLFFDSLSSTHLQNDLKKKLRKQGRRELKTNTSFFLLFLLLLLICFYSSN